MEAKRLRSQMDADLWTFRDIAEFTLTSRYADASFVCD